MGNKNITQMLMLARMSKLRSRNVDNSSGCRIIARIHGNQRPFPAVSQKWAGPPPDAHLILICSSRPAQVIQEFAFWNESLWKSRFMHRNLVRLRLRKIKERRGNIPRILEMFGELRLSLFHRYFRFMYAFVFLDHLSLVFRLFLSEETFSFTDQLHNSPHSVFVVFYVEQNSCICGFLSEPVANTAGTFLRMACAHARRWSGWRCGCQQLHCPSRRSSSQVNNTRLFTNATSPNCDFNVRIWRPEFKKKTVLLMSPEGGKAKLK